MSHLRAPAARADRREGGRHGRPVARTAPPLPETHIRPQLLRLAVLPPIAVALSASAAVLFTVRSTGARPGLALWAVLAGAVARRPGGHRDRRRGRRPRRQVRTRPRRRPAPHQRARRRPTCAPLVEQLRTRRGPARAARPRRPAAPDADDFELLAADLSRAHDGAVTAVVQAAQLSSQRGQRAEGRGLRQSGPAAAVPRAPRDLDPRRAGERDRGPGPAQGPLPRRPPRHPHPPARREPRRARRRRLPPPVEQPGLHDRGAAVRDRRGRAVLAGQAGAADRRHPARARRRRRASTCWPNSSRTPRCSRPRTPKCCCAPTSSPSGLAVEVEDRGLGMPAGRAEQDERAARRPRPGQRRQPAAGRPHRPVRGLAARPPARHRASGSRPTSTAASRPSSSCRRRCWGAEGSSRPVVGPMRGPVPGLGPGPVPGAGLLGRSRREVRVRVAVAVPVLGPRCWGRVLPGLRVRLPRRRHMVARRVPVRHLPVRRKGPRPMVLRCLGLPRHRRAGTCCADTCRVDADRADACRSGICGLRYIALRHTALRHMGPRFPRACRHTSRR